MVQFGTSGWRGVIGREVTFRKVRMVTQALVETLRNEPRSPSLVVVGYDTRMLSEKFARAASELLAANDIRVELTPRDLPSPVVASMVVERSADAGLIFTGSHNPPEYNGLKIYTAEGILAPKAFTDRIEQRYRELVDDFDDTFLPQPELIDSHDPKPAYLKRLQEIIHWDRLRDSGIHLVVDPLFGTTREYLDHILLENEIPANVIHNTRDPYFGGYAPDCTSVNLTRLRDVMRRTGAHLGLANDGDGDRFGILDQGARLVDSSLVIALVLDYLARHRGLEGTVARTLATSSLFDAVARHHGLEVIETTVGFKNFSPGLVDGSLSYAGEESAGLAWGQHLAERDGMLACLLVSEMVAVEGRSLSELAQDLADRVGTVAFRRTQVPLTERNRQIFEQRLGEEWSELDGLKVERVDRRDGLKLIFAGGSWLLLRLAGTEPKIRLYAEGRSGEEMRHLMHLARQLLTDRRL